MAIFFFNSKAFYNFKKIENQYMIPVPVSELIPKIHFYQIGQMVDYYETIIIAFLSFEIEEKHENRNIFVL